MWTSEIYKHQIGSQIYNLISRGSPGSLANQQTSTNKTHYGADLNQPITGTELVMWKKNDWNKMIGWLAAHANIHIGSNQKTTTTIWLFNIAMENHHF